VREKGLRGKRKRKIRSKKKIKMRIKSRITPALALSLNPNLVHNLTLALNLSRPQELLIHALKLKGYKIRRREGSGK